jgi:hypothetical protein
MSTTSLSGTSRRVAISFAFLERLQLAFDPAQVEEQLLLRGGRADLHQRPGMQDVFLDRGADPPHRIGGEAEALVGIEALHGLHQANVAFRDDFGHGQAIAAIAHRDLRDQAQMAGHHLMGGFGVLVFLPALGQHELLALFQHGELANLRKIAGEVGVTNEAWKVSYGHVVPLWCPLMDIIETAQSPSHYDCRRAADDSLHGFEKLSEC